MIVSLDSHGGASVPCWNRFLLEGAERPLEANTSADICIVGAGVAGLSIACTAAEAGLTVVLIDSDSLAGGETSRSSAHLSSALDDRYFRLERVHGRRGAAVAAESHAAAIDWIEEQVRAAGIECGFARVDGYLVVPLLEQSRAVELLERERLAAQRAGVPGVHTVGEVPCKGSEFGPALRFPNQGEIDPVRYARGLLALAQRRGVRFFPGTRAHQLIHRASVIIQTGAEGHGPVISAGAVVIATNTPFNDVVTIHTKQAAYRTYVVSLELPSSEDSNFLLWDGRWSTRDPYHYVRTVRHRLNGGTGGRDLLLVGGEDHKSGQDMEFDARCERLEAWARARFPHAGRRRHCWSGQIMQPHDGLGFIGRNPSGPHNVFVVTGDSGSGLTHGTIAGQIITDLILGQINPWAELYSPGRISLMSTGTFLGENANAVMQYADWLGGPEVRDEADIGRDEGAVMCKGLHRIAVYRDSLGRIFRCSATCPHLGGAVRWNAGEKTWDCPCHGSRFDRFGTLIHGPAAADLARIAGPERSVSPASPAPTESARGGLPRET